MHTHMHIQAHIYTHAHTRAYTHIYIHTYTHAHTHITREEFCKGEEHRNGDLLLLWIDLDFSR